LPLLNRLRSLSAELKREEGQTITEYAFVAGGVSVVLLAAFVATGILDDFAALLADLFPD
jgi:Flp pilus assembly pilin Flp